MKSKTLTIKKAGPSMANTRSVTLARSESGSKRTNAKQTKVVKGVATYKR